MVVLEQLARFINLVLVPFSHAINGKVMGKVDSRLREGLTADLFH